MPLYICKPPTVVMATHGDDQIAIDPVKIYGVGAFVLCDYGGPSPTLKYLTGPNGEQIPDGFNPPTITDQIRSDSCKLECRRRITKKVSDQAQRNITTHINDIQMDRMTQSPARPATPAEQSDMDSASAIWAWIGAATRDPASMLGSSDAMITAKDDEWYQDVKWPPWNAAWDAFVARF
jgi:hypothetical protein